MIEITESKISQLSELAEKMLKYGGKLMQTLTMTAESGTDNLCLTTETNGDSVITTMKHTRKGTRKETPTQGEGAIRKPGAGERPKTDSGPYKNKEI